MVIILLSGGNVLVKEASEASIRDGMFACLDSSGERLFEVEPENLVAYLLVTPAQRLRWRPGGRFLKEHEVANESGENRAVSRLMQVLKRVSSR